MEGHGFDTHVQNDFTNWFVILAKWLRRHIWVHSGENRKSASEICEESEDYSTYLTHVKRMVKGRFTQRFLKIRQNVTSVDATICFVQGTICPSLEYLEEA